MSLVGNGRNETAISRSRFTRMTQLSAYCKRRKIAWWTHPEPADRDEARRVGRGRTATDRRCRARGCRTRTRAPQISRMSSVIAIANTPSLNASSRPVPQRSPIRRRTSTARVPVLPAARTVGSDGATCSTALLVLALGAIGWYIHSRQPTRGTLRVYDAAAGHKRWSRTTGRRLRRGARSHARLGRGEASLPCPCPASSPDPNGAAGSPANRGAYARVELGCSSWRAPN